MPQRFPLACLGAIAFLAACGTAGLADPVVGPAPQRVGDTFVPDPPGYRAVPWVENLEAPWSLVFLPDGRALVSERPGRIRLIRDGGGLADEPYAVLDADSGAEGLYGFLVDLFASGEGGLMGLAVHPRFPEQPYVYAMHTYRGPDGAANRVIRLVDEGDRASFDRVIIDGLPGAVVHNGGRIAFGPDGMLYVTAGDAREPALAQDPESPAGKILRLTPEGGVPDDNPFPGSPVYALGLRNAQGLAWHPETGDLFASTHGPTGEFGLRALDEVNVIEPGGNYGWPGAVGAPGLGGYIDPIVAWPDAAVPPAGATFHDGGLFVAMLGSGALIRIGLARDDGGDSGYRVERIERWFAEGPRAGVLGRIRDAVVGPDGRLYFLTSNRDGRGSPRPGDDRIYRLEPTG